ncbi:MAG: alpha-L-fucosidase [Kiritimatiellia bacterium]|nr:alpha-L-fucosidase [Kiritimatiellia bacterium]
MSHPIPEPRIDRFEHLAYGLFLHWGLYSQMGKGEWVMHREAIPPETYNRLAQTFTADTFDARAIARSARKAGMKYIVLTTRHHDGFSLYDTKGLSKFDAPHSAAKRDLVAEYVAGCRAEDIVPFFYHTTLDWQWNSAQCPETRFNEYLDYLHASVEVLCTAYGPIGGLWFDGNWSRKDVDWKESRLYGLIRKNQPEAMIINNTGLSALGVAGHPEIDSVTFEQGLPTALNRENHPKYVSGEMCQTLNRHWGIGARDFHYLSPKQIIENLASCRKVGANYLLNVGPTAGGSLPDYERAALERCGDWARLHAKPVYDGRPVTAECEGRDFLMRADGKTYYFAFDLGPVGHKNVTLEGGRIGPRAIGGWDRPVKEAHWMDSGETLKTEVSGNRLTLDCTGYPYGTDLVVRVAEIS